MVIGSPPFFSFLYLRRRTSHPIYYFVCRIGLHLFRYVSDSDISIVIRRQQLWLVGLLKKSCMYQRN